MGKYIMALDQGTTSSRCILFDKKGNMCSVAQKEYKQYYPKPGWVEHDPKEIWSSQISVATEAMSKIGVDAEDIHAIGITNQRETTIVWDKKTGEPVYPAIVWQCRRTADMIEKMEKDGIIIPFSAETKQVMTEVEDIRKDMAHKPFHPESEAYQRFLGQIVLKIERLIGKYPYLDFQKETELCHIRLNP